jgi:hypothetical protein
VGEVQGAGGARPPHDARTFLLKVWVAPGRVSRKVRAPPRVVAHRRVGMRKQPVVRLEEAAQSSVRNETAA